MTLKKDPNFDEKLTFYLTNDQIEWIELKMIGQIDFPQNKQPSISPALYGLKKTLFDTGDFLSRFYTHSDLVCVYALKFFITFDKTYVKSILGHDTC